MYYCFRQINSIKVYPSLDTNDNIRSIPDSQIEHLDISTNIKGKKSGKRVTIVVDESSEEEEEQSDIVTIGGKHVFIEDIQPDRFMQVVIYSDYRRKLTFFI